jgi:hypothetical protein
MAFVFRCRGGLMLWILWSLRVPGGAVPSRGAFEDGVKVSCLCFLALICCLCQEMWGFGVI